MKKPSRHLSYVIAAGAGAILLVSCSPRAGEDATVSSVDSRRLEIDEVPTRGSGSASQELVTSCNSAGCWSAKALRPVAPSAFADSYSVYGRVSFVGPPGEKRRMGVCLLKQYAPVTPCTEVAHCANAPTDLPSGGFRYCTAPGGSDTKSCFYRPGRQADFCAGSPADPARNPIAPGIYKTPASPQYTSATWISDACFEGCSMVAPSVSRPASVKGPVLDGD